MQSFDPRKRPQSKKKKRPLKLPVFLILLVLAAGAVFAVLKITRTDAPSTNEGINEVMQQNIDTPAKSGKLKIFTGEQFKDLYNNFAYPNTARINENTPITGDAEADAHIRKLAEARGYVLRSAPVTDAFIDVGDNFKLQQRAAQPWLDMKEAAKKDGYNFGLMDAYRSADDQREIFVSRLNQQGVKVSSIERGTYDAQINQVLSMTAIPGYSRHHSGYTVDIVCENQPTTAFKFTACFEWLSEENYKNAKTHGWIPSYPEETELQGPEPESWEYVWVGVDALTE